MPIVYETVAPYIQLSIRTKAASKNNWNTKTEIIMHMHAYEVYNYHRFILYVREYAEV